MFSVVTNSDVIVTNYDVITSKETYCCTLEILYNLKKVPKVENAQCKATKLWDKLVVRTINNLFPLRFFAGRRMKE